MAITLQAKELTKPYRSFYLQKPFDIQLDYRITLVKTGQVFTLTDFTRKKVVCNGCAPFGTAGDFAEVLDSYMVNGKKVSAKTLLISN